jgi:hypothetical protein
MRCLLKRKGATKQFKVTNIKRSPNKRYEFFCTINKDVCRVTLDLAHEFVDELTSLHPKDTIFRGEFDIVDYQIIDQIYIVVLLPAQIFIVDYLTE